MTYKDLQQSIDLWKKAMFSANKFIMLSRNGNLSEGVRRIIAKARYKNITD